MENRDLSAETLLFVIGSIGGGGAERVITQVANYMSSKGCRVVMATSFIKEKEYPLADEIIRINLNREGPNQSRLKRNVLMISALRRACKKYKPAAVISFMAESNFRSICATAGLPVKCIISVRNDPVHEYSGKIYHFVARHILPYADGCVFQTEEARSWFPEKLQRKSTIIYNAVDAAFFAAAREPEDIIVTLGRLCEQKNHAMLIRAFAEVAPKYPEVQLQIYGEGDLEEPLRQLISELSLTDRVRLMGATRHSAEALSRARIFAMSSDFEGMPNALMEAMAAGVPCISTDCPCGGPKMLLEDGYSGFLVPVNNIREMARAMERLLSDRALAEQMGRNAKKSAAAFERDTVLARWENYIAQICGL